MYFKFLLGIILSIAIQGNSQDAYSFFLAGHPSSTLGVNWRFMDKYDYLESRTEIEFGVFLGDMVRANPTESHWEAVDLDLVGLDIPFYRVAGNHDVEDRPLYESRYGSTYYSMVFNNDLFFMLDPNLDAWNISGDQLTFVQNTLDSLSPMVDNIFVLHHQLLWREVDNIYASVYWNSDAGRGSEVNFWSELEPLFSSLSNPIVFCSGDVGGASWSSDFMYDKYDNITLMATGMGEGIGDNFLVVNVEHDKSINIELICLDNDSLNCFGDIENYVMTNPDPLSVESLYQINKGSIFISASVPIQSVQIIDLHGRTISYNKINAEMDMVVPINESYSAGIYFVKLSTNSMVKTEKIFLN